MTRKKTRLISLLLSFCMVLSLLPGLALPAAALEEPAKLLIAEVYGGGISETGASAGTVAASHSFIELYNPNNFAVSLDGYAVHYQGYPTQQAARRTGESWAKLALDPAKAIPAKGSYLINCGATAGGSTLLLTEFDQVWEDAPAFVTKGAKYVITYGDVTIPAATVNPFNTDGSGTKIEGYIDMFGGAGNDTGTTDRIDGCETAFLGGSNGSSKQKGFVRTDRNSDTDNNAADFSVVAFNSALDAITTPRSLASGVYTSHITVTSAIAADAPGKISVSLNKACGELTMSDITVTRGGDALSGCTLTKVSDKGYEVILPASAASGEVYTLSVGDKTGFAFTGSAVSNNVASAVATAITADMISIIPDQVFRGAPIEPSVTVSCEGATLTKDVDYTLSYQSNVAVGTASVTVTAKAGSDYTGSADRSFAITSALPDTYGTMLTYLGSYSVGMQSGDGGVAEIVKYNKDNRKIYVVSGQLQSLDIVSLAGAAAGTVGSYAYEARIDISAMGAAHGFSAGDITSVDVNTRLKVVAISVQHADFTQNGAIVFLDYDGAYVAHFEAGNQPDMVGFTPDGNYVMTADEGEPREGYGAGKTDPKGSVTIIDLRSVTSRSGLKTLPADKVNTVTFESFDTDAARAQLVADLVLLKTDALPSEDLEPEYIAFSADGATAYVSLQEASAVAAFDIAGQTFTSIKGLGFKDHSQPGNEIDLNNNGQINIQSEAVYGLYMPDGLAALQVGGIQYVLTPNEGDAREWDSYADLDSKTIGGSSKKVEYIKNAEREVLKDRPGDTFLLGGRSFSIWKADTMERVYDSGADFERVTAEVFPTIFNASHKDNAMEGRSNKKGPEPEDIKTLQIGARYYAFIGLERIGGLMMYDITDPAAPAFVDYYNNRDPLQNSLTAGDLGAEGICVIPAGDSPTGYPMVLVANEVSGTITVLQMNEGYTAGNTLTLYHTNDLHGSVAGALPSTVSQLAKIAELKHTTPNSLLVDGGDAIQGNAFATLTKGADVITLMNLAGYDVMVAGNHEFDYGLDTLLARAEEASFPILSANSVKDGSPVLQGITYAGGTKTNNGAWYIKEIGGVKVGFFGITTPETATKTNPDGIQGVAFGETVEDMISVSQTQLAALKAAGATVFVGIMHLGVDASSTVTSDAVAEAFTAGDKPDVIIDGHSHSVVNETVNGIYIAQTGSGGSRVGKVTITIDPSTGRTTGVSGTQLSLSALTEYDAAAETRAKALLTAQQALLSPVVGKTETTLWGGTVNGLNEARAYETNLGSLIADAMLDAAKTAVANDPTYADMPVVALQNGGGVRAVIKAGSITRGDVISVLPFGNSLAYKLVTPKVLFQALENGVGKITAQSAETGKLTGLDGRFPQIAGMRFEFDPRETATTYDGSNNPVTYGTRVTKLVLLKADGTDGLELSRTDDTTQIILASNDFEIAGGDGYSMLKGLPSVGEGGVLDAVLEAYLTRITPSGGVFRYPNTMGRIKTVGAYAPAAYTAYITLKKNADTVWASTTVNYKVDGVSKTGTTDAAGLLTIAALPDGPHAVTFANADDVLVNNYSGAGLQGGTGVTVTSASPSIPAAGTVDSGDGDTGGSGPTVTPVVPQPTTSGGTATAAVTAAIGSDGRAMASVAHTQIAGAISAAAQTAGTTGQAPRVQLSVQGAANASAIATTLTGTSLSALISAGIETLTISSPVASVSFDQAALASIGAAGTGSVTLSVARADSASLPEGARQAVGSRPVYEFSVTGGTAAISQFGGSVSVAIPYTPAAGEDVNAIIIYYVGSGGSLETVTNGRYDPVTGRVTFTTTHFSRYAVGYHKVSYSDVAETAWYAGAVSFIAAREITTGTGSGTFSPDAALSRGQFLTLLLRAYGIAPDTGSADNFADAGNTYYTGYLASAKRLGISEGVGGNLFAPEVTITRQEMFTLLYNTLKAIGQLPQGDSGKRLSDFGDAGQVSAWAQTAMKLLVETGTVSGSGGSLNPAAVSSRADMAQVLYNLLAK